MTMMRRIRSPMRRKHLIPSRKTVSIPFSIIYLFQGEVKILTGG